MKKYLTIDLSADAGRHITGWWDTAGGFVKTEEVYRFSHGVKEENGHLVWDLETLLTEVKKGIQAALTRCGSLESLTICGWCGDYVLMKDGEEILPCYTSADKRTDKFSNLTDALVSPAELYEACAYPVAPGSAAYQLITDQITGRLDGATAFLTIPEYLMVKLGASPFKEATQAAASGLLSEETGEFNENIISKMNLPEALFPPITKRGTTVGSYKGIRLEVGVMSRSAAVVEGIPAGREALYLFSGEHSLLGIKTEQAIRNEEARREGYFNETGVGYNRFQKVIPGMNIVDRLTAELCPSLSSAEIQAAVAENEFPGTVDVNSPVFLAPNRIKYAFDSALQSTRPVCTADYLRAAYRSLAAGYRKAIEAITEASGADARNLYIVGESSGNTLLNRMIQEASGKNVQAVNGDVVALGNFRRQVERVRSEGAAAKNKKETQPAEKTAGGAAAEKKPNNGGRKRRRYRGSGGNHQGGARPEK